MWVWIDTGSAGIDLGADHDDCPITVLFIASTIVNILFYRGAVILWSSVEISWPCSLGAH